MRGNFSFKTDISSEIYCLAIAQHMVVDHKISDDEAIERVSQFWNGQDMTDEDCLLFHESPEHWAGTIYFDDQFWWKKDIKYLAARKYSPQNNKDI